MKRIQFAALEKTIHFKLKDDIAHDAAVSLLRQEVESYKQSLERRRTKYKVRAEETQPDGSVIMKITTQYNDHNVGNYLD